ncbi:MAG TPA: hypothetical protein EYN68_10500, partial [Candidatus Marinimicrobia bacterium]|nr:hypothetical protein [Candidatus Neomarinimicrobiota bacterium]
MKDALAAVKETESSFKSIERAIKKQFPTGSQNSPIYLYLKKQYTSYSDIVKRTNTAEPLFKKNGAAYEKMFGGVFKRKDNITTG